MPVKLRVLVNEDDALLYWRIPRPISGCRGFAIQRRITRPGHAQSEDFLLNRTGFENEKLPPDPKGQGFNKPSTEWPFQRFSWTDHDANTGDIVQYRVIPMVRNAAGKLEQLASEASAFSESRTLGSIPGATFQPFFNRGFVISQFMARFLKENNISAKQFKNKLTDATEKKIRDFLSGDLRIALLEQMQLADAQGGEIFAALFELSDPELIAGLTKLGKRAHVVLSNGSITANKGEGAANARKRDENETARKALKKAKVDVEVANRFLSPGALGHNKFLIRVDKKGKPVIAWTGSTNWAPTGLCTQVNNGLLINDADIAKIYLDQWKRLRAAKSAFPKELVDSNSKPKPVGKLRSAVWFTKTSKAVDMAALTAAVEKAKQGVLFLMFMPGGAGLFATVAKLSGRPDLYVRGVVSELPNGRGDESAVDVNLIDGAKNMPMHLDIVQPEGVKHGMAKFAGDVAELSHKDFIGQVGHAIIHSKIVVVDPFSDDPTVITGSHNFSSSASGKNDENFIVIQGDKQLAEAYAVNIEGAYAHYRFRAFLAQTNKPFNGLQDNDTWQAPKLAGAKQELDFFGL
jgi:hypothetical protein